MKFVLLIWSITSLNGQLHLSKHSTTFYPDMLACEFAAFEFAERMKPYTLSDDHGYRAECMTKEHYDALMIARNEDLTKPFF